MSTKTQTAVERLAFGLNRENHLTGAMRACAEWTAIEAHDKILDLNCGGGALLQFLSEKYCVTLCGMCESIGQARYVSDLLGGADVISGHMEDIPWRDNTFDSVLLSRPIQGDARMTLLEVLRVLKPGGQFVLAMPLLRLAGESDLNKRDLMQLMESCGFHDITYRPSLLSGVISAWKPGGIYLK